jgi:hypothetical protein
LGYILGDFFTNISGHTDSKFAENLLTGAAEKNERTGDGSVVDALKT